MFDREAILELFHQGEYAAAIAQIDAAWKPAHAEALRQIESHQEPTALVECLRIALLESGMRSWAATRSPAIVARAVEVGLWTKERALALAEIISNHAHETPEKIRAALNGDVGWQAPLAEVPNRGLHELYTFFNMAQEYFSDEDCCNAWYFLLPHLSSLWLRDLVETAITFTTGIWWRNGILNPIAYHLNGELLEKALYTKYDFENGGNFILGLFTSACIVEDEAAQDEFFDYAVNRIFSAKYPFYINKQLLEPYFLTPQGLRAVQKNSKLFEDAYERAKWMPKGRGEGLCTTLKPYILFLKDPSTLTPKLYWNSAYEATSLYEVQLNELDELAIKRKGGRGDILMDGDAFSPALNIVFARAYIEADGDNLGSWEG